MVDRKNQKGNLSAIACHTLFTPKNGVLRDEKTCYWDIYHENTMSQLGPTPCHSLATLANNGVFICDTYRYDFEKKKHQNEAFLKKSFMRHGRFVIVIYHRIRRDVPDMSEQFVHLIEKDNSANPVHSFGKVDYYDIEKV